MAGVEVVLEEKRRELFLGSEGEKERFKMAADLWGDLVSDVMWVF